MIFSMEQQQQQQQQEKHVLLLLLLLMLTLCCVVLTETDPSDVKVLNQFRNGLKNPELLPWPENGGDPCGNPSWKYIFCNGKRVSQIQAKNLNLIGPLPQSFNQLTMLENLGLQNNKLNGPLPSFSGLKMLKFAFLNHNEFDSIPYDFFEGLESLEVLALDYNVNLNASNGGWKFPLTLQGSTQLTNVSCISCNMVGPIPEFLGSMVSLSVLQLSGNNLSGAIPTSFKGIGLQILWLNNQGGGGLDGTIDVFATMVSLTSLWLHGNNFKGTIPKNIGDLASLKDLNLNGNQLVGVIPDSLAKLQLEHLDLNNNHLMGPTPKFVTPKVTFDSNNFCETKPGVSCSYEVMALIEFLSGLDYPLNLVNSWIGDNPCEGPWLGIKCNANGKVSMIILSKFNFSGTLSPSVAKLDFLVEIRFGGNKISGVVPSNWTSLRSLKLLDLSGNNISGPLPSFDKSLKIVTDGNPLLMNHSNSSQAPSSSSTLSSSKSSSSSVNKPNPSSGRGELSSVDTPSAPSNSNSGSSLELKNPKRKNLVLIVTPIVGIVAAIILLIPIYLYCFKGRNEASKGSSSLVVHPRDPSDSDNVVKVVVASNGNGRSISTVSASGSGNLNTSGNAVSHVIEAGNLVISVQVLRGITKNFAPENELGRGGFGGVYKGELDDGTKIAVKRMEAGVISRKALDEFQSEIAVLSKVRHRNLVSLLGYSVEGTERLLVYEYMPQGALSKHLFQWKSLRLEPLSWKRRLNIALDVARGMEYLHTLAHQSFIHRDLKSSNILLSDDFRAKVSDFGLVKLAPDGKKSVVTRLAGTFGYLAPEYAVTGKITTKADVFSFGVVLMELLTGLTALDEDRPEESQYLAAWFWNIKSDKEKLMNAIDPALEKQDETFESISIIAELAGHCTAREPNQRPDMGYAVSILAPLVEKWKPIDDETEEYCGIDYSLPLNQMVKGWQEMEGKDLSHVDLQDSKSSIPARPTGFADSFTSADGR